MGQRAYSFRKRDNLAEGWSATRTRRYWLPGVIQQNPAVAVRKIAARAVRRFRQLAAIFHAVDEHGRRVQPYDPSEWAKCLAGIRPANRRFYRSHTLPPLRRVGGPRHWNDVPQEREVRQIRADRLF